MSTYGWIYNIGGLLSMVMGLRFFYKTSNEDLKVKDIPFMLYIAFFSYLLSWVVVVIGVMAWINHKWGDVVLIKRKKK